MNHDKTSAPSPSTHKECCGGHHHAISAGNAEKPFTDPVCGMKVAANPEKKVVHEGTDYYFCGMKCVEKFKADPGRYLHPEEKSAAPADGNAIYTCPMHPEIEQVGPGSCPICGMALEPLLATAEEDTSELDDMKRRFTVSLILTVPLLAISMSDAVPGMDMHHLLGAQTFDWTQAALATPVVLWGGWPFLQRAWSSFRTWKLNMFSLIGLGVAASYLFSLFATLMPEALPAAFRMHGEAPVYFEAAAVIVTLVLLGQVLELRARARTNSAVKALLALAPNMAVRVDADGKEEEVPLEKVHRGDILRVKPGTNVPVDGELIEGQSHVDESMITGEPMPVGKHPGSKAVAGTVNQNGSFLLRAEKVGSETLLSHIVQMVNRAGRSRAPIQKLADRVSGWFVPAVIAAAVLAFAAWALLGPAPALAHALVAAVSVLIIACPCALGLATPISIMVGVGRGASEGVLIKDAQALESMEKIDTLVIDKTGTLTEGRPAVQEIIAAAGFDRDDVLLYAAALEKSSEHPLAHAVVAHAAERKITLPAVGRFESAAGAGVRGEVSGRPAVLGNARMMQAAGIDISPVENETVRLRELGRTVVYVGIGAQLAGLIAIADTVKANALEAVEQLRASGLRIVMLTGDNATTAHAVASGLGLDEVKAEVLPEDKLRHVQELQRQGRIVAMAGDGVNDAPALMQANVGIAMGTGTDVAMNSAHVVLVKGDLRGIVKARALSRATMRNIRQNLFFAFIYNFVGVPVAAGILYPWFDILLSPMIASAAMSLSSVSVIGNALRLRRIQL